MGGLRGWRGSEGEEEGAEGTARELRRRDLKEAPGGG